MKPFKDIGITYKLLTFFLLVGIVPIIIIAVYFTNMSKHAILERTYNQLTSVRVVKRKQIEAFFEDRFREMKFISESEDISQLINILNNYSHKKVTREGFTNKYLSKFGYNNYLIQYLDSCDYYERFFTVNNSGQLIVANLNKSSSLSFFQNDSIENFSMKPLFDKVFKSRKTEIQDYTYDLNYNKTPSLYIASPIFDKRKKIMGVIIGQISLKAINRIMLEKYSSSGLGKSGEVYLVGNDYLIRSASRFRNNSVIKIKVETISAINAIVGKQSTQIINDYRGIPVLSSYDQINIKGLKWAIIAEIDFSEAMIPVNSIQNDIFYMSILMIIIIIGLSYVISKNITMPIIELKNATKKVGDGNYDINLYAKNNDELGKLTSAFNLMTNHIKEQTEELIEREERLQHFYKATIDGIFLHENKRPVLINSALSKLTGYSAKELLNLSLNEIIQCKKNFNMALGKSISYETIAKRKNKKIFPVEVQESSFEYNGRLIQACVIRDISEKKKIEEAYFLERKKRLTAVFDGQEMERQRLSREIHDGIGQRLIALKLMLESIDKDNIEKTIEIINNTKQHLDSTVDEIRQIANNLMPPVLKKFGLENALKYLCNNIVKNSNVAIIYNSKGSTEELSQKIIIYLYRISQEAVNNAIKHANASEINVQLFVKKLSVLLIIEDNGIGFDLDNNFKTNGNGINNIRERVNLLSGKFDISSSKGYGTIIKVNIPIK